MACPYCREDASQRLERATQTYIKLDGSWCYRYRAIDADGDLVDSMLSATREMDAAARVFARALAAVGHAPEEVTTDGHDAYPRATRETLGPAVRHRWGQPRNHRIEQDYRGIKQRYHPLRGFGSIAAAARFCTARDERRDHSR